MGAAFEKSGPLIIFKRSFSSDFGFSRILIVASITSLILCDGISVAIPTAIPDVPFSKITGSFDGNITGSNKDPSKLGCQSTVPDFGELEKLQVSNKGPSDFVTNADLKAEKVIIEELKKARPNYSIISEESGIEENKDKNNTWIIDPIDGTMNFLHGVPHFAISIALKSDNEIVSGLIFDPIKDEMFFAEKNNGAFFNNHRIKVSKKNQINKCLFAIGGKIERQTDIQYRRSGSAALDIAYVAAGRYDGYFQKDLKIWDIAAGIVLIKEAGGLINEIDLSKSKKLDVIASSPDIYQKLLKKIENF